MNPSPEPPALLRWTRFKSDPHGTGPEKRSAQILELAQSAGFTLADMQPPTRTPRLATWVAGLVARLQHGSRASVDRAGIGLLGYRSLFYQQALAAHRGHRVLLWETTYDDLLPALARAAGYRIVGLPHNLESLVSERVFSESTFDPTEDLGAEIRRLRRADAVFTISREERWLLEARGLLPLYLPFFPTRILAAECSQIRERRTALSGADGRVAGPLLLMGSAFNPATSRGMRRQLEWLAAAGYRGEVAVAGAQTEVALAAFASPRIKLHGAVTRQHLTDLLASCSALLIHTEGGGGAVTRIPEALLAGVPLIANSNAARDQHGTPGVHIYEDEADFTQLASAVPPMPPAPPRPHEAESRFVGVLRQLAGS